jgi:RNA-binding protein 25
VVKSWEPVTNPIDGTRTGFGFGEFESAEGSLRAMRLLNKLSVDGQELVVCPGCTSFMLASSVVN